MRWVDPLAMRRLFSVLLALTAVLSLTASVYAHAELVASEPEAGSTVAAGLNRLILAFNEAPAPGSRVTIFHGTFEEVPGVNSYVANGQLWADVDPPLEAGTYTVQ